MSATRDKGHREFHRLAMPATPDGDWQQVLSDNFDPVERTGSLVRLVHWPAGKVVAHPVEHDYREEILVLSGDLVVGCAEDGSGGETFTAYSFATRPAGVAHGPFTTRTGCLMLEIDLYE